MHASTGHKRHHSCRNTTTRVPFPWVIISRRIGHPTACKNEKGESPLQKWRERGQGRGRISRPRRLPLPHTAHCIFCRTRSPSISSCRRCGYIRAPWQREWAVRGLEVAEGVVRGGQPRTHWFLSGCRCCNEHGVRQVLRELLLVLPCSQIPLLFWF